MADTNTQASNAADGNQAGSNGQNAPVNLNQMINAVSTNLNDQNQYQFSNCIHRSMILLGRTRTGKSTLVRMLQDPYVVPEMPSLFADTQNFNINRITTTHRTQSYSFTFIDSPGLFEAMRLEGTSISNTAIKKLFDQCITRDVTHIHAFAFVFSSAGGINIEDIESMIFVKKYYPNLSNHFMLIITHCEEKDEADRRRFTDEFFQHPKVVKHGLREFFGLGVFYTGSLRPELQNNPNVTSATDQARNVLKMRETLLDFLIARDETYNIHYTPAKTSTINDICKGFGLLILTIVIVLFLAIIFAPKQ